MPGDHHKRALIAAVQQEYQAWLDLLEQLPPAQRTSKIAEERFSVHDVLAHFIGWQQRLLNMLQHVRDGTPLAPLQQEAEDWPAALERLNSQAVTAARQQPFEQVRGAWERSLAQLLAYLHELRASDLDPDSGLRLAGQPIAVLVRNIASEHMREHRLAVTAAPAVETERQPQT